MRALLSLVPPPVAKLEPTHAVYFDAPLVELLLGSAYRVQRHYCFSHEEAVEFARGKSLGDGPARIARAE